MHLAGVEHVTNRSKSRCHTGSETVQLRAPELDLLSKKFEQDVMALFNEVGGIAQLAQAAGKGGRKRKLV